MEQLRCFLNLGAADGTYYVGERGPTKQNAAVVVELAEKRGKDVVAEVARKAVCRG